MGEELAQSLAIVGSLFFCNKVVKWQADSSSTISLRNTYENGHMKNSSIKYCVFAAFSV